MRIAPTRPCQSRIANSKGDAVGLYRDPQWGEKKNKEKDTKKSVKVLVNLVAILSYEVRAIHGRYGGYLWRNV